MRMYTIPIIMFNIAVSTISANTAPDTESRINACIEHQIYTPGSYTHHVEFCRKLTACHDNPHNTLCAWYIRTQAEGTK